MAQQPNYGLYAMNYPVIPPLASPQGAQLATDANAVVIGTPRTLVDLTNVEREVQTREALQNVGGLPMVTPDEIMAAKVHRHALYNEVAAGINGAVPAGPAGQPVWAQQMQQQIHQQQMQQQQIQQQHMQLTLQQTQQIQQLMQQPPVWAQQQHQQMQQQIQQLVQIQQQNHRVRLFNSSAMALNDPQVRLYSIRKERQGYGQQLHGRGVLAAGLLPADIGMAHPDFPLTVAAVNALTKNSIGWLSMWYHDDFGIQAGDNAAAWKRKFRAFLCL
jgi:hypothetical protein